MKNDLKNLSDFFFCGPHPLLQKQNRGSHLELDHGAEVVVPEEDAELALLHGGRQLTEAVVRQLSGRVAQELLGHDAWRRKEKSETRGKKSPEKLWTEMEMAKNRWERIRPNHGGL